MIFQNQTDVSISFGSINGSISELEPCEYFETEDNFYLKYKNLTLITDLSQLKKPKKPFNKHNKLLKLDTIREVDLRSMPLSRLKEIAFVRGVQYPKNIHKHDLARLIVRLPENKLVKKSN